MTTDHKVSGDRELWLKAIDEMGEGVMATIHAEERSKCEISYTIDKMTHYKYLVVKIELDGVNDIEEMARIAGQDPKELQGAMEIRTARMSSLVRLGYVKVEE